MRTQRPSTAGFTLLELLVTIAVAAILVTVAAPSLRHLVQYDSMAANLNDLVGALNYARTTAVTRGRTVYVCSSLDGKTCTSNGDWSTGWLIYMPASSQSALSNTNATALRSRGAVGNGFVLTSDDTTPMSFNSNGFAMNGRTFLAGAAPGKPSRAVCVAVTGRVEAVQKASCS